ncbi:MAG: hypothetical protein QM479_10010 [Pseudomonadota bacterium]
MSLINQKIQQPSFKQLRTLLEQLLQNMLAIPVLTTQQKTTISEQFRQVEVLLSQYPQQQINVQNFNDAEIEEQIAQLIEDIKSYCHPASQDNLFTQCNEWYLAYYIWRSANHWEIHLLEPIVNSIAEISNVLRKPEDLSFMLICIQQLLSVISKEHKDDMLYSDPRRPWRVLLLNYGIVATRSYNGQLIEQAYDYFYQHLPEDAANFFTEAKDQMVAQNYPQPVRDIVEKYYQQYVINQSYKKQLH